MKTEVIGGLVGAAVALIAVTIIAEEKRSTTKAYIERAKVECTNHGVTNQDLCVKQHVVMYQNQSIK